MSCLSIQAHVHRRCFADSVRIEHIVHLDASLCDDIFFGPLRELLMQDFRDVRDALHKGGLRIKRVEHAVTFDELEHALARLAWKMELGFLVKARQPYFIVDGTGCFGYSWELSRTRWFFDSDYAGALRDIHRWAAHNRAEAQTRLHR